MKKIKAKLDENLYYFTYGLFLFGFVFIGWSAIEWEVTDFLYGVIRAFTAVSMLYLTALNFFTCTDKKYLLKKFCVLAVMSVILLASYKRSEIQCFLTWFLLTVPAEGKSIRKIVDVTWWILIISVSSLALLAAVGIIPNVLVVDKGMSLGFNHPNSMGAVGMAILCVWMVRRYSKFSVYDIVGMIFLTGVIYYFTRCKTLVLGVVFMLALVGLFKTGEKSDRVNCLMKWVTRLILPFCIGISFIVSYLYNEESMGMALLNKALTGRFWLAHLFLEKYSVTLLGQRVLIDIPLDNMYIRAWLESGLLIFILVWGLYYITMNVLFKRKEYNLVIACCVYALYGISEVCVYLVGCNFTLLLIAQLFPATNSNYKIEE